jgi:hypothetical protein
MAVSSPFTSRSIQVPSLRSTESRGASFVSGPKACAIAWQQRPRGRTAGRWSATIAIVQSSPTVSSLAMRSGHFAAVAGIGVKHPSAIAHAHDSFRHQTVVDARLSFGDDPALRRRRRQLALCHERTRQRERGPTIAFAQKHAPGTARATIAFIVGPPHSGLALWRRSDCGMSVRSWALCATPPPRQMHASLDSG